MERRVVVVHRASKRTGVMRAARERYLRDDVDCAMEGCRVHGRQAEEEKEEEGEGEGEGATPSVVRVGSRVKGRTEERRVRLGKDAAEILVPDSEAWRHFYDVLRDDRHVLVPATVLSALVEGKRTARSVKCIRELLEDGEARRVAFVDDASNRDVAARRARDPHASPLECLVRWLEEEHAQLDLPPIRLLRAEDVGAHVERVHGADADIVQRHESLAGAYQLEMDGLASQGRGDAAAEAAALGQRPYLSDLLVEQGLAAGRLVRGTFAASRASSMSGSVTLASGEIVACPTASDVNRALDGDTVVVELRAVAADPGDTQASASDSDNDSDDDDEDLSLRLAKPDASRFASVVAVLQRQSAWEYFVCTVRKEDIDSTSSTVCVVPMRRNVPKIRIRLKDIRALADMRLVVMIDDWPASSRYPAGHLLRVLGNIGSLETETVAILMKHGCIMRPFTASQLDGVDGESRDGQWKATARTTPGGRPIADLVLNAAELARRRDLRAVPVFSIDPPGCQDIDDALSFQPMGDGTVQVGVHIADVTHYVAPGSPLDIEAALRATSVYLVDRRIDMLPGNLSENLCSLRSGVDRLAVSVVWTLDEETHEIRAIWFGRTVIRNRQEMAYADAQAVLDGKAPGADEETRVTVHGLAAVARRWLDARRTAGAVELASVEAGFELDGDGRPTAVKGKQHMFVHDLVAELMIQANSAVAARIVHEFADAALVRHHGAPGQDAFALLASFAANAGIQLDASSNLALAETLRRAEKLLGKDDPAAVLLLKTTATMAMQEAKYVSSGKTDLDMAHYGLAVDVYTHFTSPIRRYADVIVHRQLLAAVAGDAETRDALPGNVALAETAAHLNECNREAKYAGMDSVELFQHRFFAARAAECQDIAAVVCGVTVRGLRVFMPAYGLKGTVPLVSRDGHLLLPGHADDERGSVRPSAEADGVVVLDAAERALAQYALFDHVRVAVVIRESRYRGGQVAYALASKNASRSAGQRADANAARGPTAAAAGAAATGVSSLMRTAVMALERADDDAVLRPAPVAPSLYDLALPQTPAALNVTADDVRGDAPGCRPRQHLAAGRTDRQRARVSTFTAKAK